MAVTLDGTVFEVAPGGRPRGHVRAVVITLQHWRFPFSPAQAATLSQALMVTASESVREEVSAVAADLERAAADRSFPQPRSWCTRLASREERAERLSVSKEAIDKAKRCLKCLALEVPEAVYEHVRECFDPLVNALAEAEEDA